MDAKGNHSANQSFLQPAGYQIFAGYWLGRPASAFNSAMSFARSSALRSWALGWLGGTLRFGKPFSSTAGPEASPIVVIVGIDGVTPTGDGAEMTWVGIGAAAGGGGGAAERPGKGSVAGGGASPGKGSVAGGTDATTGLGAGFAATEGAGTGFGAGITGPVLPGSGVEETAWFDEPDGLMMSASDGPTGFGLAAMSAWV